MLYSVYSGLSMTKRDSVSGIGISDSGPENESAILIRAALCFIESLGQVVSYSGRIGRSRNRPIRTRSSHRAPGFNNNKYNIK